MSVSYRSIITPDKSITFQQSFETAQYRFHNNLVQLFIIIPSKGMLDPSGQEGNCPNPNTFGEISPKLL